MTKVPTITLTPNRSPGPPVRYSFIVYRREGAQVRAFRVLDELEPEGRRVKVTVIETPVARIRGCHADAEFEEAWLAHVSEQSYLGRTCLTLAQRRG